MNMQEFLTKLTTDKALTEKMTKAATPDEAYAAAKEAGLTESFETFMAAMKKLNEAAGEMSQQEVDAVTGGSSVSDGAKEVSIYVSVVVSGTGVTAGALAAANAAV